MRHSLFFILFLLIGFNSSSQDECCGIDEYCYDNTKSCGLACIEKASSFANEIDQFLLEIDNYYESLTNEAIQVNGSLNKKLLDLNNTLNETKKSMLDNSEIFQMFEKNHKTYLELLNLSNNVTSFKDDDGTSYNSILINDSKVVSKLNKKLKIFNSDLTSIFILCLIDNKNEVFILRHNSDNQLVDFETLSSFDEGNELIEKVIKFSKKGELINLNKTTISTLTHSDSAIISSKNMISLEEELQSINHQISKLENYIMMYSSDEISKAKSSDRTRFEDAIVYYNTIYPDSIRQMIKANEKISKQEEKDHRKFIADSLYYEKQIKKLKTWYKYEGDIAWNYIKRNLKDPYSASFDEWGWQYFADLAQSYPCVKVVYVVVRAKNSWGAYGVEKYWVAIKGNKALAIADESSYNYGISPGITLQGNIALSDVECDFSDPGWFEDEYYYDYRDYPSIYSIEEEWMKSALESSDLKFTLNISENSELLNVLDN